LLVHTFRTLPPQHVTLALFISIILTDPAPHAPFVSAISVASPRSQPSTGSKRAVSRMANSPSPRSCAAVMSRTCIQRGESNGFSCRCAPVVDRPQQGQSSRQLIWGRVRAAKCLPLALILTWPSWESDVRSPSAAFPNLMLQKRRSSAGY
jgi:hypothetical protein